MFILLIIIILLEDHIKVFILNQLIISRGILVPNCFWYSISQKLVNDGSGIDLFYKLKKRSDVPVTYMFGYKTYMITKESIEERKETIVSDIETVKGRLTEYDQKKLEDTALLNALTGALQQCDYFLNQIHNDNGDDGNDT